MHCCFRLRRYGWEDTEFARVCVQALQRTCASGSTRIAGRSYFRTIVQSDSVDEPPKIYHPPYFEYILDRFHYAMKSMIKIAFWQSCSNSISEPSILSTRYYSLGLTRHGIDNSIHVSLTGPKRIWWGACLLYSPAGIEPLSPGIWNDHHFLILWLQRSRFSSLEAQDRVWPYALLSVGRFNDIVKYRTCVGGPLSVGHFPVNFSSAIEMPYAGAYPESRQAVLTWIIESI